AQIPAGTGGVAVTVQPGQAVFRSQHPGTVPQIPEPFGSPTQVGIQRQPYLDPGAETGSPMLLPIPVRQSAQTNHGVSCRLAVSAQALRALLGQGTLGLLRITLDDQPQTLPGGRQIQLEADTGIDAQSLSFLPFHLLGQADIGPVAGMQ